jgi:hypothetical protein
MANSGFGGSQMPVLKFLCPTTRAYFDSGVRLDEASAAASRLKIVRVRCGECHREHRFLLADGILDPADSLARTSPPKRRGAAGHSGPRVSHWRPSASITSEKHLAPSL